MQEALQVAYRPMPASQTVEYEEDFGRNMLIHREFVSKKYRRQMAFDMSSLAYSDVELRKGQRRLADAMNRERRGVLVGGAGTQNDRVFFDADLGGDEQAGQVESARYLFNERRMQYCDRFQKRMREVRGALQGGGGGDEEDSQVLFSLMEACAIVYGCDTTAAQEAYYRMFCGLDLDSLEEDAEALAERQQDAVSVQEQMNALREQRTTGVVSGGDDGQVQQVIDAMPSLFDLGEEGDKPRALTDASGGTSSGQPEQALGDLEVPEAFAPLYKSYLAHTRGETPVPSHDPTSLVASRHLAERRQWRSIMEKLIREEYGKVTREELKAAAKLNEQLHTLKFIDLKVGDTVKEVVALLQRHTGDGSSVHRDTPLEMSASHPERRV